MAELEEGFQYGLSSNSVSSSNKSVVHVKLTDTSLKKIEDYIKRKSLSSQKPCIQFDGNHGTIQIPESGDMVRTFQFSLSGIQGDRNGSYDAVQQRDTRTGEQLTLEGSMSHKIQVAATNEIFQATKDRVTQAELDSKKGCTKEIKQSGPNLLRKKVIRHSQPLPQPRHQPPPPSKPKPPSAPPVNFVKRPSPSYGSQGHAVSPHNPTTVSAASVMSSKPTSPSMSSSASSHSSSNTSSSRTSSSAGGNAAVMSMPYRDRIIHLLAIRPYKKPEIIIRLRKDGIREKDKDSLGTVLAQVAIAKDNAYTLSKHAYTDVRMDWPFYTDEDREILKKKLQSASSVSPSTSPANRSPDSQSSNTAIQPSQRKPEAQKRPIEDNHSNYNAKKKRVSRVEPRVSLNDKTSSKSDHHRASSSDRRRSSSTDRRNNVSSTTDLSDKKENINATVDSTSDTPEYMGKYFSISTDDQRGKYKSEFNIEYEEYRELHTHIEKVCKKFYELQIQRKKTPKDTIEYEDLEARIRTEYVLQKSDPKYIEQKKRFEYLHGKLAFIKKLILDYDQRHMTAAS